MGNMLNATNTFDAFEPIYWFIKAFGFYASRYRTRGQFPFSASSLIHVGLVLTINLFVFYLNADPRPFLRATNITIINYGLWLQIESAMALTILFLIANMALYRYTWQLWAKYECVDRDLKLNFGIYIPYGIFAKLACIAIVVLYTEIVVVSYIEYCNLSAIPNLPSPLAICASSHITNLGLVSTLAVFICSCQFLMQRCHYVNMLLEQLLSDEPLSDAYEFVNNSRTFVDDLKYMNQHGHGQRKASPSNAAEPFGVFDVQNCQRAPPRQPNDKLNPTAVASPRPRINAWTTATNRIGNNIHNDRLNAMYGSANENTMWDPEIDKLVSKLPLSKIRILGRMIISQRVFTNGSDSECVIRKLDQLFRIYIDLIDCFDLLNSNFSKQIFVMIITSSVFLLFGLFAKFRVYVDYQKEADDAAYAILAFVLSRLLTGLLPSILATTGAMNKLLEISRKLNARRPVLGCGYVVFDGKIVLSFVASICMQLIMLIQFYLSFQNV